MADKAKEHFMKSFRRQQMESHNITSQRENLEKINKLVANTSIDFNRIYDDPIYHKDGFFDEQFYNELEEAEVKRQLALEEGDLQPSDLSMCDPDTSPTVNQPSSVIDDQYFGNFEQSNSNSVEILNKFSGEKDITDSDLGPIDAQYFSPSTDNAVEQVSSPSQGIPSVEDIDDLNIVDKQMFGIGEACSPHSNTNNSSINTQHDKSNYQQLSAHCRVSKPLSSVNKTIQTSVESSDQKMKKRPGVSSVDLEPRDSMSNQNTTPKNSNQDFQSSVVRSKGELVLNALVPDLSKEPSYCVVDLLVDTIVYEDERVVCLNKPYSLASQDGEAVFHSVTKYLPELAKRLKYDGSLYLCHRLDKSVSGVLLLAKGEAEAVHIKRRFEVGNLYKFYTALTCGVPKPLAGVIDIPIGIDTKTKHGIYRSVLLSHDTKTRRRGVYSAVTKYQVVKQNNTAALVELEPETGRKHQLRVHLADGISTPILGDHKYSHRDKLAPQWLHKEILTKFNLKPMNARQMPLHLHARRLVLPNYFRNGQELTLTAKLPKFFSRSIKLMKFFRR
ncbi:RPUSD4 [Bugula neritina]|uniref:Pseudouridylate synthase RPUSD4, mitochondrial n=1 Tax=Bugula neritina TaxID=10212 RepID=A0A7J7J5B2_BUGNE|nr:RPUSD4 [Bugula neritina]